MPDSPPPTPERASTARGAAWTPLEPAELGRLLPQYEILSLLGRGGMGAVYYAVEKALDRPVALKLLPAELSAQPGFADRFTREARAMAKLSHPNIVALHEFGRTSAGHLFFTMEFVEGTTLAAMIHGPGLNPDQALVLSSQICLALAYAHGQGVVHRDMKPSNILVDTQGRVKIADFGLARLLDPSEVAVGHTVTGAVMGTPDYMAPEQKRGLAVDHRADIYSLGVMLYEMLCRQTPQGAFPPPSKVAGCAAGLDRIVERAMQPAPERRYQSTTEMKADVDGARAAPRMTRRRRWPASIAALSLVGCLVWLASPPVTRWWRAQGEDVKRPPAPPSVADLSPGPARNADRVAAEWLLGAGGVVHIHERGAWRTFTSLKQLPTADFTLLIIELDAFGKAAFRQPAPEEYRALAGLTGLQQIWFRQVNIPDEALAFLRNNPGLKTAKLHSLDRITDAALDHLADAPLEELDFMHCRRVRSAALARLNRRATLKKLIFVNQQLDDAGAAGLREFTALELLNIYANPLTDEGLRALAGLPKLTQLIAFSCPNVTGTALADFAAANKLTYLNLNTSAVGDAGCAAVSGLTELRELNLARPKRGDSFPPITDAGLAHLAKLKNLKKLNLESAQVTPEGIRAFQEAVPGCVVER